MDFSRFWICYRKLITSSIGINIIVWGLNSRWQTFSWSYNRTNAQRYSTVSYRERGFSAHPLRRNSKHGVSDEVPLRKNSVSGSFEVPVRSDTPPCLIENEVFWRTLGCAETLKTEFLRFPCAETPVVEFLRFPCAAYSTGNGVLATVRKTSGSGVSEDPVRYYSITGCFVGSQMIHWWNLYIHGVLWA